MATLWIEEYTAVPTNLRGANIPLYDATKKAADQKKAVGAASAQSNAFSNNTRFITVHSDVECYIEIGSNPSATTSTTHLAEGVVRDFQVKGGWKIAVKDTS